MAKRIIAVMNQTPDVGKTTITANLGYTLSEMGYRILMLDMDPQADLSQQFKVPQEQMGMDAILNLRANASEYILSISPKLDLICAGPNLALFEQNNAQVKLGLQLEQVLTSTISSDIDIILIDCAAISGLLGTNAILAATDVLVPVAAEPLALQGMIKMLPVLRRVSKLKAEPVRLWLCVNRLPQVIDLAPRFKKLLNQYFPKRVLNTVIFDNVFANPEDYQALANDLLRGRAD